MQSSDNDNFIATLVRVRTSVELILAILFDVVGTQYWRLRSGGTNATYVQPSQRSLPEKGTSVRRNVRKSTSVSVESIKIAFHNVVSSLLVHVVGRSPLRSSQNRYYVGMILVRILVW